MRRVPLPKAQASLEELVSTIVDADEIIYITDGQVDRAVLMSWGVYSRLCKATLRPEQPEFSTVLPEAEAEAEADDLDAAERSWITSVLDDWERAGRASRPAEEFWSEIDDQAH